MLGIVITYLLLYAFLRFTPGDTQVWFFKDLADSLSYQIRCLLPLWILLTPFAFYSIINILRNVAFRRTSKTLKFLLDTEVPMRGNELRPYENQFEGNGSTNNWQSQNYAGEINEKRFSSNISMRIMNRYLSLAEQLRLVGEFSPARRLSELAQKIAPNHPAPPFMLGKIETNEGEYQNALVFLRASQILYRRSSNVAHIQERQALIYFFLGKYENAEQTAEKALKEMPSLLTTRWILGLAQIKQGKTIQGHKNCKIAAFSNQPIPVEIQKAIQGFIVDEDEWINEINDTTSKPAKHISRKSSGTIRNGVAVFFLVALLSTAFIALVSSIKARFDKGEFGLSFATALLTVFPDAPTLLVVRGDAYYMIGEYDKALSDHNQAIHIDPEFADAYNGRGFVYAFGLNEYNKAIAEFTRGIVLDPELSYPYRGRGQTYFLLGEYEKAITDCTFSIHINPKDVWGYDCLADVYLKLGENEKAIASYAEAIHYNPESIFAYFNRAHAYWVLGKYEKAVADYTEVIHLKPLNEYDQLAYTNRGLAYMNLGEYEKAVADFTESIRIDPKWGGGYYNRGNAYNKLGQYEKAIADYAESIRLVPELAEECPNASCEIAVYTATIDLNPNDAQAYKNRGNAYDKLGQYEKATTDYTEAILLDQDIAVNCDTTSCYIAIIKLDPEKANQCDNIPYCTAVINLNLNNAQAYEVRGRLYISLDKYDEAIADLTEAIRLNPKLVLDYYLRGVSYSNLGKYEEAIADFSETIRLDHKYASAAYKARGDVYNKLGEYDKAVADYITAIGLDSELAKQCDNIPYCTAAIKLDPNDTQAYNNLGYIYIGLGDEYFRLGMYEKAVANHAEAIRIARNTSNIDLLHNAERAVGYRVHFILRSGRIEQVLDLLSQFEQLQAPIMDADILNDVCWNGSLWGYASQVLDICEQAVRLEPDNADIRDSRGLARALTGDFEGAILDFQYFVEHSSDSDAVAKRKQWILELQKGNNPFTPEVLDSLK